MGSFRAQDMVIATLERFFEEHSPKFSRLEYRRLLIFLMSLVTSHADESFTNVDSLFSVRFYHHFCVYYVVLIVLIRNWAWRRIHNMKLL